MLRLFQFIKKLKKVLMFKSYLEKNNMQRVTWFIMTAYKDLFLDESYNNGDQSIDFVLGEVTVVGCWGYAKERNVPIDFIDFTCQKVGAYIEKNNRISLEVICYTAASLRGDFSKHKKNIGSFFGSSARKLDFDKHIFDYHDSNVLSFYGGVVSAKTKLEIPEIY